MLDRFRRDAELTRVLQVLRRRWWVVVLIAIISAGAAYVFAKRQPNKYSATAALLFQNSALDQRLFGNSVISQNSDPTRQAATNQALVELPSVARLVARQLGVPTGRVATEITFGSDAQADVLTVTAIDRSPTMAARLANAYVHQYIIFRQTSDQAQLTQAEQTVKAQLAAIPPSQSNSSLAQSLQSRSYELSLLASLQTGNAEVVETALPPSSPSSPNPPTDAAIGLVIGLLLAGVLVFGLERYDRRIKAITEVEEIYGVPIIGTIPESQTLRARGAFGSPREQDAFRMVRMQLRYFDVDRDVRSVMVTSSDMDEGKSMLSLNLARAAASTTGASRTLLIEADMRRPSQSRMLGLNGIAGLSELLSDSHDLSAGLRELVVPPSAFDEVGPPVPLDILTAGAQPPNPLALLESARMSELLRIAESMYDLVVIDTPPIAIVSDAISLIHQVDGVVVVSRMGYSRRDHALSLIKQLRRLNAQVLGVVVNGVERPADYYGYYSDLSPEQAATNGRGRSRILTGKGR